MGTPAQGPWTKYQQQPDQEHGPWEKYQNADSETAAATTPPAAAPSVLDQVESFAGDVGKGMLRGAGHTANAIGSMLIPDRVVKAFGGTPPTEQQKEQYFAPRDTGEKIGYGAEQAGEFLAPMGAEEKAVSLIPKFKTAARIGLQAVDSGLINKAQGGDFTTGAVVGGAGGAIGEGLKAAAPKIAESALGIRKLDRAYGRTPGQAIIDETVGVRPSTIENSARGKSEALTKELENRALTAPPVSLKPARSVLSDAVETALDRNNASTLGNIQDVQAQLGRDLRTSTPTVSTLIPETVPARRALDLKRGIGDLNKSWNPEIKSGMRPIIGNVYGALDSELDKAIPGGDELNQRISTLIPVADRAEGKEMEAGVGQRVINRLARSTGALAGGLSGAWYGGKEYGTPGAIAGGITGLFAPEVVTSPTFQMYGARTLASPFGRALVTRPLVGGGLQLARPDDEDNASGQR